MKKISITICALAFFSVGAQATVLTFDIAGLVNSSLISQDYGDNVTATTMGDFSYGDAGGFTPNVTLNYLGAGGNQLNYWTTGYNDLINVIENEADGAAGYSITFTAETGYLAVLNSFNMGNFGAAITLPGLSVVDQNGLVLFSQANIALPDSTATTSLFFDFGTSIQASELTVLVDTTGLGGSSDNVGLDNIQFSQTVVPVPAAVWLMGSALLGLAGLRRKT